MLVYTHKISIQKLSEGDWFYMEKFRNNTYSLHAFARTFIEGYI